MALALLRLVSGRAGRDERALSDTSRNSGGTRIVRFGFGMRSAAMLLAMNRDRKSVV